MKTAQLILFRSVSFFRKIIAFFISFSLMFSNFVWAYGPRLITEEIIPSHIRTYSQKRIGIVDAKNVFEGRTQNIFEEFKVPFNNGIIFKISPETRTTYNRVYSSSPVVLMGNIESDHPSSMVFSNPGGVSCKNLGFKNVPFLSLIAGNMGATTQGMAYEIEEGRLTLDQTLFTEDEDLKVLSLVGKDIKICQSIISPSQSIDITTGSHIGVLENQEDENHPAAYVDDVERSQDENISPSLYLDKETILRSGSLFIRSFDKKAPLDLRGILQSTQDDIIIRAQGDIYLSSLSAAKNLRIETNGNVFLDEDVWAGGHVKVKARSIHLARNLSAVGKVSLQALEDLKIYGSISGEDKVKLKGIQQIALQGTVSSKKSLSFLSEGEVSQNGFIYSGDNLNIVGKSFFKQGRLLSKGDLSLSIAGNLENLSGDIASLQNIQFSSKSGDIVNRGEIFAQLSAVFKGKKTRNYGHLETQGSVAVEGKFCDKKKSSLKAKTSIRFDSQDVILKGKVKTKGILEASGGAFSVQGKVLAKQGAIFSLKSLLNTGKLSVLDGGVEGSIESLVNGGSLSFSSLRADITRSENKKEAILHTTDHFMLTGTHFDNAGILFTHGVHQVNLKGSYKDSGTLYAPTLFLLNARQAEYFSGHHSFLVDGLVTTRANLSVSKNVKFHLASPKKKCFLQLASDGDLQFNGRFEQFSTLDYSTAFESGEKSSSKRRKFSFSPQSFKEAMGKLSLKSWETFIKDLGSGLKLVASKSINCEGSTINPESGSVVLMAQGNICTKNAQIKSGAFIKDKATLKGENISLDQTYVESLYGISSIIAEEIALLNKSTVEGGSGAFIKGKAIEAIDSHVSSSSSTVAMHADQDIRAHHSILKSVTESRMEGRSIFAESSTIQSDQRVHVKAQDRLQISTGALISAYNKLISSKVETRGLHTEGSTLFDAKDLLLIEDLEALDEVFLKGEKVHLKGKVSGKSVHSLGEVKTLINDADLAAQNALFLKAKHVKQRKTTHAQDSHIEAIEEYEDTESSHNSATEKLSLIAEEGATIQGQQRGDVVEVRLKDMDLIKLMSRIEARLAQVHLQQDVILSEDLILKSTLHLWANRLENKKRLISSGDFLAYIQTSIVNQGVMDIYGQAYLKGTEGITNRGAIQTKNGLTLESDETVTQKGRLDGGGGDLRVKAKFIDGDAEILPSALSSTQARFIIPHYSGKNIFLQTEEGMNLRGAQFTSTEDTALKSKGKINQSALSYSENKDGDDQYSYLQSVVTSGGRFTIETSDRYEGRAIKARAKGGVYIDATQGIDIASLAAVSVVERWNYNTGLFGQNNHRGFKEGVVFYQTDIQSEEGIQMCSSQGGISLRGAFLAAQQKIQMTAKQKVDVGTIKATIHHESRDESGLGGIIGTIEETQGSTEKFVQLQTMSNRKIEIMADSISGDGPSMMAPEITLEAENGIHIKPIEIASFETTHRYDNTILPSIDKAEFQHEESHTQVSSTQQLAASFRTDHFTIRTGSNSKALFTANIGGFKENGKTDITSDTPQLIFSGTKNTYSRVTDSWSAKGGISVTLKPTGGASLSHAEQTSVTYESTSQNIGSFNNKREGTEVLVHEGARTRISQAKGLSTAFTVDETAQDEEHKSGYGARVSASSTSSSFGVSRTWGGIVSADKKTALHLEDPSNTTVQRITHEDREKDDRGSIRVDVEQSTQGVSTTLAIESKGRSFGVTIPLNEKALSNVNPLNPKNMKDGVRGAVNAGATVTQNLENNGVNMGPLNKGFSAVQQGYAAVDYGKALFSASTGTAEQVTSGAQQEGTIVEDQGKAVSSGKDSIIQKIGHGTEALGSVKDMIKTVGVDTSRVDQFVDGARSVGRAGVFAEKAVKYQREKAAAARRGPASTAKPVEEEYMPAVEREPVASSSNAKDVETEDSEVSEDELKGNSSEQSEEDSEDSEEESAPKRPAKKAAPSLAKLSSSFVQSDEQENTREEFREENPFVRLQMAHKKAQCLSEGKAWDETEEAKARREVMAEVYPDTAPYVDFTDITPAGRVIRGARTLKGAAKVLGEVAISYASSKVSEKVGEASGELAGNVAGYFGASPETQAAASSAVGYLGETAASMVAGKAKGKVLSAHKGKKIPERPKDKRFIERAETESAPKETHSEIYSKRYQQPVREKPTTEVDNIDRYKEQLFERPGKDKRKETSLQGARTELKGGKTAAAIRDGRDYDHVEKVEGAQRGLLKNIKKAQKAIEEGRGTAQMEKDLSKASSLLDHSEGFVPRSKGN